MRTRKKKWTDEEIQSNDKIVVDAISNKGSWNKVFGNDNPIYVEIGSGKGRFLCNNALKYPDINFIGLERQESVLALAGRNMDKIIPNALFVLENATNLQEIFEKGEVKRVYLNFSDPWHKKRYYKRRLTYRDFLAQYEEIMNFNSEVFFKTDNKNLFEFSLNEFCNENWKLSNISLDLHNSDIEDNIMTEYEEKFSSQGNPIYRLEARKALNA